VTRTLADLETRGLVARTRDADDARRHVFSLTAEGLAALGDDMRPRDAWLARAMAEHLSPTEQQLLVLAADLLDRLAESPRLPAVDHALPGRARVPGERPGRA
jgi:DNA-binding MarR family transcriptional regulator